MSAVDDYEAFSKPHFDQTKWINSKIALLSKNPKFEEEIGVLASELQSYANEVGRSFEEQASTTLSQLPRVVAEIDRIHDLSRRVRGNLSEVTKAFHPSSMMPTSSSSSASATPLAQNKEVVDLFQTLHRRRQRLELCRNTLSRALAAKAGAQGLEALASRADRDPAEFAAAIRCVESDVAALGAVPDVAAKLQASVQAHKKGFVEMIKTSAVTALRSHDTARARADVADLEAMGCADAVIVPFGELVAGPLQEQWKDLAAKISPDGVGGGASTPPAKGAAASAGGSPSRGKSGASVGDTIATYARLQRDLIARCDGGAAAIWGTVPLTKRGAGAGGVNALSAATSGGEVSTSNDAADVDMPEDLSVMCSGGLAARAVLRAVYHSLQDLNPRIDRVILGAPLSEAAPAVAAIRSVSAAARPYAIRAVASAMTQRALRSAGGEGGRDSSRAAEALAVEDSVGTSGIVTPASADVVAASDAVEITGNALLSTFSALVPVYASRERTATAAAIRAALVAAAAPLSPLKGWQATPPPAPFSAWPAGVSSLGLSAEDARKCVTGRALQSAAAAVVGALSSAVARFAMVVVPADPLDLKSIEAAAVSIVAANSSAKGVTRSATSVATATAVGASKATGRSADTAAAASGTGRREFLEGVDDNAAAVVELCIAAAAAAVESISPPQPPVPTAPEGAAGADAAARGVASAAVVTQGGRVPPAVTDALDDVTAAVHAVDELSAGVASLERLIRESSAAGGAAGGGGGAAVKPVSASESATALLRTNALLASAAKAVDSAYTAIVGEPVKATLATLCATYRTVRPPPRGGLSAQEASPAVRAVGDYLVRLPSYLEDQALKAGRSTSGVLDQIDVAVRATATGMVAALLRCPALPPHAAAAAAADVEHLHAMLEQLVANPDASEDVRSLADAYASLTMDSDAIATYVRSFVYVCLELGALTSLLLAFTSTVEPCPILTPESSATIRYGSANTCWKTIRITWNPDECGLYSIYTLESIMPLVVRFSTTAVLLIRTMSRSGCRTLHTQTQSPHPQLRTPSNCERRDKANPPPYRKKYNRDWVGRSRCCGRHRRSLLLSCRCRCCARRCRSGCLRLRVLTLRNGFRPHDKTSRDHLPQSRWVRSYVLIQLLVPKVDHNCRRCGYVIHASDFARLSYVA